MNTRDYMDMYIRRYYGALFSCARYWCSRRGIPGEAYDCLADAFEVLCRKPESVLLDLIRHELAGEKKLFFYTRKILHFVIIRYGAAERNRHLCPLNEALCLLEESGELGDADENFARSREVEALFRSDDYTERAAYCKTGGTIYRYVTYTGRKRYPVVRYQARREDGKMRSFSCLSAASAFLPPPGCPLV